MPYVDLREYVAVLESKGKLLRVRKHVDKDWEISAVFRAMFQRCGPAERRALLFENVTGFDIPVLGGILGASDEIYAMALGTSVSGIEEKWVRALTQPIPPILVEEGPCKQNVLKGDDVDVLRFPIPTWTAGEDPAPYITAGTMISKDPETAVRNASNYRIQIKGGTKLGCMIQPFHDGSVHVAKNEKMGRPTEVAIVIGSDPTVGLAAVADVPYGVDELGIAGGLRGAPLKMVRCETVDLEVPAAAEIVLEGEVRLNYREPEGPFGEYQGYMSRCADGYVIDVKCITHRDDPLFHVFMAQAPPNEHSCIRRIPLELLLLKRLRELSLPVRQIHLRESVGSHAYLAISIAKTNATQAQQVMWGAWSALPLLGKITVVVDDDIDVTNAADVDWAISYRAQPERDVYVVKNCLPLPMDPSGDPARSVASKLGIDATKKFAYPPRAIPPAAHIEAVNRNWKDYGF